MVAAHRGGPHWEILVQVALDDVRNQDLRYIIHDNLHLIQSLHVAHPSLTFTICNLHFHPCAKPPPIVEDYQLEGQAP